MNPSLFETHLFEIKTSSWGKPIYICPFSDVHFGHPLCDLRKFREFIRWARTKERCYLLGVGDYIDAFSSSERMALFDFKHKIHRPTAKSIDDWMRAQTALFSEELKGFEGRIIGLLDGNHSGLLESGITTTQYLCEILGCRYLGISSFIRIVITQTASCNRKLWVDVFAHHGRGGGKSAGAGLNSCSDMMRIADADIYLSGHDHRKQVSFINKMKLEVTDNLSKMSVRQKKILLGKTGSYLRGWEPGQESYIAEKCLAPTDLGSIKIELTPTRHFSGFTEVDIHASI